MIIITRMFRRLLFPEIIPRTRRGKRFDLATREGKSKLRFRGARKRLLLVALYEKDSEIDRTVSKFPSSYPPIRRGNQSPCISRAFLARLSLCRGPLCFRPVYTSILPRIFVSRFIRICYETRIDRESGAREFARPSYLRGNFYIPHYAGGKAGAETFRARLY